MKVKKEKKGLLVKPTRCLRWSGEGSPVEGLWTGRRERGGSKCRIKLFKGKKFQSLVFRSKVHVRLFGLLFSCTGQHTGSVEMWRWEMEAPGLGVGDLTDENLM